VYHYTKFSTALLIIRSATLRATRFNLLNDTQEIDYAKGVIAKKLAENFQKSALNKQSTLWKFFENLFGMPFTSLHFAEKAPTLILITVTMAC
jgi:hypothetical protein